MILCGRIAVGSEGDMQLNIFDNASEGRPCDYRFMRYIGQRVILTIGAGRDARPLEGIITNIMPYYTYIKTAEGELIGTPTNVRPMEV